MALMPAVRMVHKEMGDVTVGLGVVLDAMDKLRFIVSFEGWIVYIVCGMDISPSPDKWPELWHEDKSRSGVTFLVALQNLDQIGQKSNLPTSERCPVS